MSYAWNKLEESQEVEKNNADCRSLLKKVGTRNK